MPPEERLTAARSLDALTLDRFTRDIEAVAIGASAGGIEALLILLAALPATCRLSFFIVMHIPRERPSLLPEVFRGRCALPVTEAEAILSVADPVFLGLDDDAGIFASDLSRLEETQAIRTARPSAWWRNSMATARKISATTTSKNGR